jgi:hypothetical protein
MRPAAKLWPSFLHMQIQLAAAPVQAAALTCTTNHHRQACAHLPSWDALHSSSSSWTQCATERRLPRHTALLLLLQMASRSCCGCCHGFLVNLEQPAVGAVCTLWQQGPGMLVCGAMPQPVAAPVHYLVLTLQWHQAAESTEIQQATAAGNSSRCSSASHTCV